jgi:hypothetical protein
MTEKPREDQKGYKGETTIIYQAQNPKLVKAHKQFCEAFHELAVGNAEIARDQKANGDTAAAAESEKIAHEAQADAKKWGCGWAQ